MPLSSAAASTRIRSPSSTMRPCSSATTGSSIGWTATLRAGFRPMRLRKHWPGELVQGLHLHAGRAQILRLNTDAGSWAYDVATGSWAERESFGLDYYRLGCSADRLRKTLVGDNQTGRIYQLDFEVIPRTGTRFRSRSELPPIGDGVNRQTLYSFEIFMETGVGDLTTTDPAGDFDLFEGRRALMVERDVAADGRAGRLFGKGGVAGQRRVPPASVADQLPDKVRKPRARLFADVR
jgi:hypothetical protein